MKVTNEVTEKNKMVGSLENGSVFEHEDSFYMITNKCNEQYTVCVDVNTGVCTDFPNNKVVTPRLAEVIIMNDVE